MDYEGFFKERLDVLRGEGRYRMFADLERRCGRFPRAYDHRIGAEVTSVRTDWQMQYCPLLLPARATFVCAPKK